MAKSQTGLRLAAGVSTAKYLWLWHKDRDVVTYSDGVLRGMVIAIP